MTAEWTNLLNADGDVQEPMSPMFIGFGVTEIVLLLVASVLLLLLYCRREQQPLKFRAPSLVILSGVGSMVLFAWVTLFLLTNHDPSSPLNLQLFCNPDWDWVVWIGYTVMAVPFLLRFYRVIRLFRQHRLSTVPLMQAQEDLNSSDSDAYYNQQGYQYSHKFWDSLVLRESTLLLYFGIAVMLVVVAKLMLQQFGVNITFLAYGCIHDDHQSSYMWIGMNAAEVLLLFGLILYLRRIKDDYGITMELSQIVIMWLLCTLSVSVALILKKHGDVSNSLLLDVQAGSSAVRSLAVFIASVAVPLFQSYCSPYMSLFGNYDALRSLDTLLKDMVCIQYFRQFLTKEGQVEYILCWVEIELFKDEGFQDIEQEAFRIFDKYLRLHSKSNVHISDAARIELEGLLQQRGDITVDSFDRVQHELFDLMNVEFSMFLSSEFCRQCLHELEKEENLKDLLEKSEMI